MMDTGLKGRVVLITGANNPHGIGVGVAKAFAAQGAKIFLHYFRNQKGPLSSEESSSPGEAFYLAQQAKPPDEALQALHEMRAEAHAREADLSDSSVIPALFDEAEKVLGPVDVVVNNAAYWEGDTFIPSGNDLPNKLVELWTGRPDRITAGSFDRIFAVNTRAAALMIAEFAHRHIARGANWGRVINVSTAGAYVFPSEISYGASKLALEAYTRSAAMELGQFGITVNAVSLGPVQTVGSRLSWRRRFCPPSPWGGSEARKRWRTSSSSWPPNRPAG